MIHNAAANRRTPPIPCMPACWVDDDPARALADAFAGAGISARAVGGAVRDGLRGSRSPARVEVLVAASRERLAGCLRGTPFGPGGRRPAHWSRTAFDFRPIGDGSGEAEFDRDASGRDFTVNAVRCDLGGRVTDPLGGVGDALGGRVRLASPGALRDAPVRVVRYARMRAVLGEGEPDAETREEAEAYAGRLRDAPPGDVLDEMLRLARLSPAEAVRGFGEFAAIGGLDAVARDHSVDRLAGFLAGDAHPALTADPYLRLGVLALYREGDGWANGMLPRWGDARDARVAAPATVSGRGGSRDRRHGLPAERASALADAVAALA